MPGDLISIVLLPLILVFIMFSLGLGLTLGDFRRILVQPKALVVGVVCHFVLLPLVCFAMLKLVGMGGALAVGFMIVAACPTGATSNLLTYLARGDVALALGFKWRVPDPEQRHLLATVVGLGVLGGMLAATPLAVLMVPTFFVVILKLFKTKPRLFGEAAKLHEEEQAKQAAQPAGSQGGQH